MQVMLTQGNFIIQDKKVPLDLAVILHLKELQRCYLNLKEAEELLYPPLLPLPKLDRAYFFLSS